MKKIISFLFIVLALSILINCSPKTAKKTASSEPVASGRDKPTTPAKPTTPIVPQADIRSDEPVATPKSNNSLTTSLTNMSSDEQLVLFKDMQPLRVEQGKRIYTSSCNKCHDHYAANSRTAETWVEVMRKMGPEAKLNTEQYLMVAGYLVQNAKK